MIACLARCALRAKDCPETLHCGCLQQHLTNWPNQRVSSLLVFSPPLQRCFFALLTAASHHNTHLGSSAAAAGAGGGGDGATAALGSGQGATTSTQLMVPGLKQELRLRGAAGAGQGGVEVYQS